MSQGWIQGKGCRVATPMRISISWLTVREWWLTRIRHYLSFSLLSLFNPLFLYPPMGLYHLSKGRSRFVGNYCTKKTHFALFSELTLFSRQNSMTDVTILLRLWHSFAWVSIQTSACIGKNEKLSQLKAKLLSSTSRPSTVRTESTFFHRLSSCLGRRFVLVLYRVNKWPWLILYS